MKIKVKAMVRYGKWEKKKKKLSEWKVNHPSSAESYAELRDDKKIGGKHIGNVYFHFRLIMAISTYFSMERQHIKIK